MTKPEEANKYNHQIIEKRALENCPECFNFPVNPTSKAKPFTIILPPPNVTGKLHLGHAWDSYIQDTLARYHKLIGDNVLFLPGIDHAGIATQVKVEEKLKTTLGKTRHEIGRENFLEKAYEWKEEYAAIIRKQWNTLGLALDYKHEQFTLSNELQTTVTDVFIKLHAEQLIYRGERAVNWDPKLQTVLSNIEVIANPTKSSMYYINYPLVGGGFVKVATTRPETMYSDVAIAVNPKHKILSLLIGQRAISPLTGRELPIIGSEAIEINKGTGAMKVSAHAELDFDIMRKHNLPINECIDHNGLMNERAGAYAGFTVMEARDKIVKNELAKFINKVETVTSNIGISERSAAVVEILVQPQWFVKMEPLIAKVKAKMCETDGVKFYPKRFAKTLANWLDKTVDWCISRQLWWGHRIPAWYKDGEVKVQKTSPGEGWVQDNDVLDTWFSSGLAPFAFLGWPNKGELYPHFFPTSILVTGYDIIFFWVARMYSLSLHLTGKIPFEQVLIHGLIRSGDGRKMSKSLGNGIDPMDVIASHGADALRYFLLTNSTPGLDLRFSEEKLGSAWNLGNKLWNIALLVQKLTSQSLNSHDGSSDALLMCENWILNEMHKLHKAIAGAMRSFNFAILGKRISEFIYETFASQYLEMVKALGEQGKLRSIFSNLIVIIHPFLPFLTANIYFSLHQSSIVNDTYLRQALAPIKRSDAQMRFVISAVHNLRKFRTSHAISHRIQLELLVNKKLLPGVDLIITKMVNAKLNNHQKLKAPEGCGNRTILVGKTEFTVILDEETKKMVDAKRSEEIKFLTAEIARGRGLLQNASFLQKAPKDKVLVEQAKLAEYETKLKILVDEKKR